MKINGGAAPQYENNNKIQQFKPTVKPFDAKTAMKKELENLRIQMNKDVLNIENRKDHASKTDEEKKKPWDNHTWENWSNWRNWENWTNSAYGLNTQFGMKPTHEDQVQPLSSLKKGTIDSRAPWQFKGEV